MSEEIKKTLKNQLDKINESSPNTSTHDSGGVDPNSPVSKKRTAAKQAAKQATRMADAGLGDVDDATAKQATRMADAGLGDNDVPKSFWADNKGKLIGGTAIAAGLGALAIARRMRAKKKAAEKKA